MSVRIELCARVVATDNSDVFAEVTHAELIPLLNGTESDVPTLLGDAGGRLDTLLAEARTSLGDQIAALTGRLR